MTRLIGAVLALVVLFAGCTPTVAGPPSARPVPETLATTSTTLPTTTTTLAAEDAGCEVFCLEYHINPLATWSDGAPVVADDFIYTLDVHVDSNNDVARAGYGMVRDAEIIDDATFLVRFTAPYGAWQGLFDRVYRDGSDPTDIEELDTTGPFSLVEWTEGESLTVARNTEWWASDDPLSGLAAGNISEIRFAFFESQAAMTDALAGGAVDVIIVRPDVATIEGLDGIDGIDVRVVPGPFWEHIGFHHDDNLLSQSWVRDVFSLALDREKILDRTVRLVNPEAEALDNTVWMANTHNYEAHFPDAHDPERAERIMTDRGCVRGDDGIQVCGDQRMSFVWASTNDDLARRQIFESAREDLEVVGIEVVGDFRSPSTFVSREFLFGGTDNWQIVNFSWRARSDPSASSATYFCDDAGDLNVNRYCSEEVEDLVRAAEMAVAPPGRAALYNRADRLYLEDLAVIPLYQKPTLIAWREGISGPVPNYAFSSDLWNVSAWSGPDSIVVALLDEPLAIDPRSRADDSANVILGAMLYGAFGMTPSHEYVPVLVENVEVLGGAR